MEVDLIPLWLRKENTVLDKLTYGCITYPVIWVEKS